MKKRSVGKILAALAATGTVVFVHQSPVNAANASPSTSGLDASYLHWQIEAMKLRPYLDTTHQAYSSANSEPTEVYTDNPGWRAGTSAYTENLGIGQTYGPPEQSYSAPPRWGFSYYGWGSYPANYATPYGPYVPTWWW
jgi:hypothetical protein